MEVNINYCNNINEGRIKIHQNILNIKHGMNGTGKATISKAIEYYVKDRSESTNDLKTLKPFKHYKINEIQPTVSRIDSILNIKIFDERYINQYVFFAR
jgi:recombinational DNA repair ATPase RecF